MPPVVLKYEMDAGGFIFWLFEGKVEGVAIALLRPFTQEGVDRFLGIFADGQTWRKEQPVYPEIPFQWQRSDGRYYAVASMEKGTFMVANSEKIRPIPAK